jgi:hypothetical protein
VGGATALTVELAVLSDPGLTERQKQSLLDVYSSFLALNAAQRPTTDGTGDADNVDDADDIETP